MGTVMMVWVYSLPLKAFDLAGLMLRKFYKACFSCCTNQAIAGSPQVPVPWGYGSNPEAQPASRRNPGELAIPRLAVPALRARNHASTWLQIHV